MSVLQRGFALVYDRALAASEEAGLADARAGLVGQASGAVLEIGAGTGLNLRHYPQGLDRLVLTEPDRHMAVQLRKRMRPDAELLIAPAEAIPVADDAFDTVVATLVLCTVPDPRAVLREITRILRPGGRLLFLEHVRAQNNPSRALWQDRLERPWGWVAGGCHPNRDTRAAIEASGLELEHIEDTRIPKAAPIVRPAIVGAAVRPRYTS